MSDACLQQRVNEYRDALKAIKGAKAAFEAMTCTIQRAAKAFEASKLKDMEVDGETVSFALHGHNQSEPPAISPTWPTAVQIAKLVQDYKKAQGRAESLWKSLPQDEQETLLPPKEAHSKSS